MSVTLATGPAAQATTWFALVRQSRLAGNGDAVTAEARQFASVAADHGRIRSIDCSGKRDPLRRRDGSVRGALDGSGCCTRHGTCYSASSCDSSVDSSSAYNTKPGDNFYLPPNITSTKIWDLKFAIAR